MIDVRSAAHEVRLWPWEYLPREESESEVCKVHDAADRTIDVEFFPGFSVDILVEYPSGEPLPETMSTVICTSVDGNYCYWPLMYHVYGPRGALSPH